MMLCLSILLVLVAMAAAGPMPQSTHQTDLNQFLGEKIADVQQTTCGVNASNNNGTLLNLRSHIVHYYLGGLDYEYVYSACINGRNNKLCYDSSKNLPRLCSPNSWLSDCTQLEWIVLGQTLNFKICDDFGVPCQKPIPGLMRTLPGGICAVDLDKTPDGKEDCTTLDKTLTADADSEGDGADEDCFCITPKGGQKVCRGQCRKEF